MSFKDIKFEKINYGHFIATLYELEICHLQVSKTSCKLLFPNFDMFVPLTARSVLKRLVMEIHEKNKKQLEMHCYVVDNDYISVKQLKKIHYD